MKYVSEGTVVTIDSHVPGVRVAISGEIAYTSLVVTKEEAPKFRFGQKVRITVEEIEDNV